VISLKKLANIRRAILEQLASVGIGVDRLSAGDRRARPARVASARTVTAPGPPPVDSRTFATSASTDIRSPLTGGLIL
jgi:hypothetical protein